MLTVTEIFKSIQGESTWAGLPCVFIRLTGCPLRCRWCDTTYAYTGGTKMTVSEIVENVNRLGGNLVEITGGEPLAQSECRDLAKALLNSNKTVLCETNGVFPIDLLPPGVIRILDIKCPGSGESRKMDWANLEKLTFQDEVKFVIADRNDYNWACDIVEHYDLTRHCYAVLFSPVWGELSVAELAKWMLEKNVGARLQIPLHKVIWPDRLRGV